jgi:hypothetical protein
MTLEQQAELDRVAREWLIHRGFANYSGATPIPHYSDTISLINLLAAHRVETLEEVGVIVENEDELLKDMSDKLFQPMSGDSQTVATEVLRMLLRIVQANILTRLKAMNCQKGGTL